MFTASELGMYSIADTPRGRNRFCAGCYSLLAAIASDDVPRRTNITCRNCYRFYGLSRAAALADWYWESVQHLEVGAPSRREALRTVREAHKNLGNYILALHQDHEQSWIRRFLEPVPENTKQSGSPTPPLYPPQLSQAQKPTLKGRRKVAFAESVVFRDEDDNRAPRSFNRYGKNYERGKHAPSEGREYLNTSGGNARHCLYDRIEVDDTESGSHWRRDLSRSMKERYLAKHDNAAEGDTRVK